MYTVQVSDRRKTQRGPSHSKGFGMEIDDPRTVYNDCTTRLIPNEDEPSIRLFED